MGHAQNFDEQNADELIISFSQLALYIANRHSYTCACIAKCNIKSDYYDSVYCSSVVEVAIVLTILSIF